MLVSAPKSSRVILDNRVQQPQRRNAVPLARSHISEQLLQLSLCFCLSKVLCSGRQHQQPELANVKEALHGTVEEARVADVDQPCLTLRYEAYILVSHVVVATRI